MVTHVQGAFDLQRTPHPSLDLGEGVIVGRMTFHKQFHGDLEATSTVEMMGLMCESLGSGGYVALERITGNLKGRKGGFVLQHSSSMDRFKPTQSITVVPDSGTDELRGLVGSMKINIVEGKHFYDFEFEFVSEKKDSPEMET